MIREGGMVLGLVLVLRGVPAEAQYAPRVTFISSSVSPLASTRVGEQADTAVRLPAAGSRTIYAALDPRPDSVSASRATLWSVLTSAALPGTGQALLGQDRFVAYLAVEAYAWARYAADVREGRRARSGYRNLAREVARRPFGLGRPVGDFEYYERMEKFVESGAYDAIPGGDLDPEPDTTTANGALWLLARQTYWSDPAVAPPRDSPEYEFAEEFYRDRAVGPEYRWSWSNAQLEYAEFRRTIRRSNNAFRTSVQDLGIVIANHALSTVDAFITVRLRRQVDRDGERFELSGSLPLPRRPWN